MTYCPTILAHNTAPQWCPIISLHNTGLKYCPTIPPHYTAPLYCPTIIPHIPAHKYCLTILPHNIGPQHCQELMPYSLAQQYFPIVQYCLYANNAILPFPSFKKRGRYTIWYICEGSLRTLMGRQLPQIGEVILKKSLLLYGF